MELVTADELANALTVETQQRWEGRFVNYHEDTERGYWEVFRWVDGLSLFYQTSADGSGSLSYNAPDIVAKTHEEKPTKQRNEWWRSLPYDEREAVKNSTRCGFTATREPKAIAKHWVRSCSEACEKAHKAAKQQEEEHTQNEQTQREAVKALEAIGYRNRSGCGVYSRVIWGVDSIPMDPPADRLDLPAYKVEYYGQCRVERIHSWSVAEAVAVSEALKAFPAS